MKRGFYSKLALSNMKKNRRFYLPRILSEAGLLGGLYIMMTLTGDQRLAESFGGYYLAVFMTIGLVIHALLTVILMFYTNSFLMKQRKREFGLYNVLGMEKRHVGKVLFYESLISSLVSIAGGLLMGTMFYKAASLLICKLLNAEIIAGFYYLTPVTLLRPAGAFLAIDLVIYLINRMSMARMKPVELLKSQSAGEREPKVKWILLVVGILSLGAGYYMSITTMNPLAAISLFFVAVLLVMLGTYCLFVTGSIFVLKCLKNNKKYYYHKNHMPAVSGLLYRMKQNAVGLASIAILATGVLIMISTTVSLYAGMEETLADKYPQHYFLNQKYYAGEEMEEKMLPAEVLKGFVTDAAAHQGLEIQSVQEDHYLEVAYLLKGNEFSEDRSQAGGRDFSKNDMVMAVFLTADQYNALSGEQLELQKDEVAFCPIAMGKAMTYDTLIIAEQQYHLKKQLNWYPIASGMGAVVTTYGFVVSDQQVLDQIYQHQKDTYQSNASEYNNRVTVCFSDMQKMIEKGPALDKEVWDSMRSYVDELGYSDASWNTDSIWDARESLYAMYGTFLFLGILLGLVFVFATAMIIYYKQISEGYEDRERFQIMKKIGMSEKEVKRTINKQILLVFYLPLIVAGIHLAFAFPMLERMLHILLLSKTSLFVICTLIVYGIFAAVYVIIYKATARTYYKIVR
ncbi:MAG: ABC transporter permease [Lachnospiraceae bacterium]|nr:ABC transporter permease [Lachnospiraceae bacterium]